MINRLTLIIGGIVSTLAAIALALRAVFNQGRKAERARSIKQTLKAKVEQDHVEDDIDTLSDHAVDQRLHDGGYYRD